MVAAAISGNVIVCLIALPLALPFVAGTPRDWLVLVYLGVFQLALAYVFLSRAVAQVRAIEVALIGLVEPVLSSTWAWLVHGETPGIRVVLGGIVILAATGWHAWREPPAGRRSPPPARSMSGEIVRTYLVITGLFNFAASLIWGVDTLFKLHAGLDIFQVMLTNAAFTAGMVVFEIPTGVVADTLGRRVSLMLCVATLLVATLLYVATAWFHWGFWPFMGTSVLLGLGYTFYTGAVDAWLVDALKATGFTEPMEGVFAKGQMIFGAAMLAGTLSGGLLGQIDLAVPYVVRAATFLPLLLLAWLGMTEIGYTPRALEWRRVPAELRRVFVEGLHFGLHHRVVRPVMFASLVNMSFMIFGFYSWQRYFLDLLGRDLVWVSGLIAALLSLSMILGNALMRPLSRVIRTRTGLLATSTAVQAAAVVACGVIGLFAPAVPSRFFGRSWGCIWCTASPSERWAP